MKIKNLIYIPGIMITVSILFYSMNSKAVGTDPISHNALESTGSVVFDMDSDIALYKSDLKNIQNNISELGIYTDENMDDLTTRITTLTNNTSAGKTSLATKINSKTGTTTVTTSNPTFNQLQSGIDSVYTAGYNAGVSASKLVKVGSGAGTYNLSGYSGYKNFTVGKNIICTSQASGEVRGHHNCSGASESVSSLSLGISYNASTGVLTVTNGYYHTDNDMDEDDIYLTAQCICTGVYVSVN